jgi:hypothetical protein
MPTLESIVRVDPNVMSGAPVFVGTRVPVKNPTTSPRAMALRGFSTTFLR